MSSVPSPTSRSKKKVHLSVWDLSCALISPVLALYLSNAQIVAKLDWWALGYYWLMAAGFALLAFFAFRLQNSMNRNFTVQEAIDIIEAVLFAELMAVAVLFTVTRLQGIPRSAPLIHGTLLAAALIIGRIFARIFFASDKGVFEHRFRGDRIIVIGANRLAAGFIRMLEAYIPRQLPVIALLDEDPRMIGQAVGGVQVLATPQELDAIIGEFAVHGVSAQQVIIAGEADSLMPATLREIENICARREISLAFLPRMLGLTEARYSDVPVKETTGRESPVLVRPVFTWLKRAIDIVGSLVLLILLSPLLVLASLLVLLDIGTPILFWQERIGWRNSSFLMYKFRTMGPPFDAEGSPVFEARQPSAIGRFLRASRLDEFPQLLNVLFGDMSFVGPRPLLPEDQPADRTIRLSVRPGITGWAQVNGGKLVSKEEKQKLDEWYVRNASLGLDLRIVLMTVKVMFKGQLSFAETLTDQEQVQGRDADLKKEAITAENCSPALSQPVGESRKSDESRAA